MSSNFRYQPIVAVSGKPRGKLPVVDDVLLSHEHQNYPTTSLDENCIEFEFQRDRNYYLDLRQMSLAFELKFVKSRGYKTYSTIENKKEQKEETKADTETTGRGTARGSSSCRYSCKQHFALNFSQGLRLRLMRDWSNFYYFS